MGGANSRSLEIKKKKADFAQSLLICLIVSQPRYLFITKQVPEIILNHLFPKLHVFQHSRFDFQKSL